MFLTTQKLKRNALLCEPGGIFSELDMIETIERAKEGYESDVEDDEDLDDIEVLEEEQQVV